MRRVVFIFLTLFLLSSCGKYVNSTASLEVADIFGDNMVLQRNMRTRIWGVATPEARVKVSFRNRTKRDRANVDGRWEVSFNHLKVSENSKGDDMIITTSQDTLVLKDVLVGDVWLCSINDSNIKGKKIKSADYPDIRLFKVEENASDEPVDTLCSDGWEKSSPEAVSNFSSIAYRFGKNLSDKLNIPIGLIEVDKSGTTVENWTSRDFLSKLAYFSETLFSQDAVDDSSRVFKYCSLYNGMINPLRRYVLKGVVWYQGESNIESAHQYRTLFPLMIKNWWMKWEQGYFPFIYLQLPSYNGVTTEPVEDQMAELRDAQLRTLNLPHTGMAVTIDLLKNDMHSAKNEKIVADRLTLIALHDAYNEKIPYSGVIYNGVEFKGSKAIVSFKHVYNGLKAGPLNDSTSTELKGFSIAGINKNFVWADAKIQGDKVIVSSPQVKNPVSVRYGWNRHPDCNLYNSIGLPASPFKTDNWKGITK